MIDASAYTLGGFVSSFLLFSFGLYILRAGFWYPTHRMAALLAFLGMVWCLGKSGEDVTSGYLAFLLGRFAEGGLILLFPVFVHFTRIFPDSKPLGFWAFPLYLPAVFFACLLGAEVLGSEYILLVPPTRIPYLVYQLAFTWVGVLNLVRSYRGSRYEVERIQLRLVLAGVAISFSVAAGTVGLNLLWGGGVGRPAVLAIPASVGVIAYAVTKYRLFVMPPVSRFFVPIPEGWSKRAPKYELEEGRVYLVEDGGLGSRVLKEFVMHGVSGLWITSSNPRRLRQEHGLAKTPILWLTSKRVRGEAAMRPGELDKVRSVVSGYLLRAQGRSVVFVDCFEELVTANGFERAMGFLVEIAGLCSRRNSNLLVRGDRTGLLKRRWVEVGCLHTCRHR